MLESFRNHLGEHLLPVYFLTSTRPFSFKLFTITFKVRREVNRISDIFTRGPRSLSPTTLAHNDIK